MLRLIILLYTWRWDGLNSFLRLVHILKMYSRALSKTITLNNMYAGQEQLSLTYEDKDSGL